MGINGFKTFTLTPPPSSQSNGPVGAYILQQSAEEWVWLRGVRHGPLFIFGSRFQGPSRFQGKLFSLAEIMCVFLTMKLKESKNKSFCMKMYHFSNMNGYISQFLRIVSIHFEAVLSILKYNDISVCHTHPGKCWWPLWHLARAGCAGGWYNWEVCPTPAYPDGRFKGCHFLFFMIFFAIKFNNPKLKLALCAGLHENVSFSRHKYTHFSHWNSPFFIFLVHPLSQCFGEGEPKCFSKIPKNFFWGALDIGAGVYNLGEGWNVWEV